MRKKRLARVVKFTPAIRALTIELYGAGLTLEQVASRVGISISVLTRWRYLNADYKEAMDVRRAEYAKGLIESNLIEAAKGAEEVEETDKFTETRVINGEEREVEKTIKRKKKAPDVSALMKLANKYAPHEYDDTIKVQSDLRITAKNVGLSQEERLEILKRDALDADYKVLADD